MAGHDLSDVNPEHIDNIARCWAAALGVWNRTTAAEKRRLFAMAEHLTINCPSCGKKRMVKRKKWGYNRFECLNAACKYAVLENDMPAEVEVGDGPERDPERDRPSPGQVDLFGGGR